MFALMSCTCAFFKDGFSLPTLTFKAAGFCARRAADDAVSKHICQPANVTRLNV